MSDEETENANNNSVEEENSKLLKGDVTNQQLVVDKYVDMNQNAYLFAVILAIGNASDAIEIICIGYIMNEIKETTTQEKEFLSAAVFIGMLIGGMVCGLLSDRIGRKPCLQYSLCINAVASIASAFSPSVTWLIFFRVIGGLGIGGSVPSVFTLGAELFPSKIRGKLISIIASFWMVGAIYVGMVGWIMLGDNFNGNRILPHIGWRAFALVCAIPVVLAFTLTTYLVPESPRYLVGKEKYTKAAIILSEISNSYVAPKDLEPSPNSSTSNKVNTQPQPTSLILSSQHLLSQLFNPAMLSITVLYMVIWFSLCFGSYGISTWISVLFENIGMGNVYLNSFIFNLATLPGNIISIFMIEKYGRKNMLAYGMILAAISALGFGFGSKYPVVVVLCASLFNAFSTVGWNALDCISVENFPTEIRTSAMGLLAAAGRLGAISAQFVNGTLESNILILLLVTSGCMFVGGLGSFYIPADTTGKSLGHTQANKQSHRHIDSSTASR